MFSNYLNILGRKIKLNISCAYFLFTFRKACMLRHILSLSNSVPKFRYNLAHLRLIGLPSSIHVVHKKRLGFSKYHVKEFGIRESSEIRLKFL